VYHATGEAGEPPSMWMCVERPKVCAFGGSEIVFRLRDTPKETLLGSVEAMLRQLEAIGFEVSPV